MVFSEVDKLVHNNKSNSLGQEPHLVESYKDRRSMPQNMFPPAPIG